MNLLQAMREVAASLGDGWSATAGLHDKHATLAGPNDVQLSVHAHWRTSGRLIITGLHPMASGERGPAITVAATRAPKAIAAEIVRRLLPPYLPLLMTSLKKAAGVEARERQRAECRAVLLAALGEHAEPCRDDTIEWRPYGARMSGTFRISSDGDVHTVRLRLPYHVAVAVFEILGKENVQ